jgi:hypothetical protein
MRIPIVLADYPDGTLSGMFIMAGAIGAILLCLFVAGAMSMTENRKAVRGWRIAAGVCIVVCDLSHSNEIS